MSYAIPSFAPRSLPSSADSEDDPSDLMALVALPDPAAPRRDPVAMAGGAIRRGVVLAAEGARHEVRVGDDVYAALQAESCVLLPEPGDVVLVSVAAFHDGAASGPKPRPPAEAFHDEAAMEASTYILAVLERRSDAPRVWQAPGGRPVTMSAERLGLRAPELDVDAGRANLTLRAVSVVSDVVRGVTDTLVWVSQRLQTVADSSVHRAGTYVRSVASVDTVVAEHISRTAHQTITSSSTNDVRTAREDVHVSAKRIHMR